MASLDHDRILRSLLALSSRPPCAPTTSSARPPSRACPCRTSSLQARPAGGARPAGAAADVRDLGLLARGSRACTCASARSPAAGCAGATGARTSAPRSSAWSRRRWSRTPSSCRSAPRAASSPSRCPTRPWTARPGWPRASPATGRSSRRCSTSPTTCVGTATVVPAAAGGPARRRRHLPRRRRRQGHRDLLRHRQRRGPVDYGFWLGDAFASGGSAGYDHKAMGITARGAWESVKRHFRELGVDTQTEDFTVVGVGDMSGDVFGNGMLLSEHIRLVAAFDHRHIFLDPDPDAATSLRRAAPAVRPAALVVGRLRHRADLARAAASTRARPSRSRSAPQVRAALGLADGRHAADTRRADEGDPAGAGRPALERRHRHLRQGLDRDQRRRRRQGQRRDPGRRRRAAVPGRRRGRQPRAAPSSAGSRPPWPASASTPTPSTTPPASTPPTTRSTSRSCSTASSRDGDLTLKQRNALLASMTDDVGRTWCCATTTSRTSCSATPARRRTRCCRCTSGSSAGWRSAATSTGRWSSCPPTPSSTRRHDAGVGLTSPEFSVLVAYSKITLKARPAAPPPCRTTRGSSRRCADYFPAALVERYGDRLASHPLRREIVTNSVVNRWSTAAASPSPSGPTEETGATPEQVARAFVVAARSSTCSAFVAAVEALDNAGADRRADRALPGVPPAAGPRGALVPAARPGLARRRRRGRALRGGRGRASRRACPNLLRRRRASSACERRADGAGQAVGAPTALATRAAALLDAFSLLDVAEIAARPAAPPARSRRSTSRLSERSASTRCSTRITALPRDDRWDALARVALRYDLYAVLESLTVVGAWTPASPAQTAAERIAAVGARPTPTRSPGPATRSRRSSELESPGIAALSVALRTLRGGHPQRRRPRPEPARRGTARRAATP